MKKILFLKLKIISKLILKKYNPKIVGITGSVGKTSTRNAVYAVISKKYRTRRSQKNYNNEVGLPLTIIGEDSPGNDLVGWMFVMFKGLKLVLFRDKTYPEVLILEMGVDRPGDMKYLLDIARPDIGIITLIGVSHLEYFGGVGAIKKEKGELIKGLKKGGWAISNFDNEFSREILEKSKAKVLTYGFDIGAKVRAQEVAFSFEKGDKSPNNLSGVSFKLSYDGAVVPVMLNNVISYGAVYAALAGASVGIAEGLNLVDIAEALSKVRFPNGRMKLIKGIKRTMLIDDTYNSAPQSMKIALDIIEKIPVIGNGRKIAILGDMLELGSESENGHREMGKHAYEKGIEKLILVGERARDIGKGAIDAGMKEDDIFRFDNSEKTKIFVQDKMKKDDLIFIKGSRGMKMEVIVKEVMADPLLAKNLLVGQEYKV